MFRHPSNPYCRCKGALLTHPRHLSYNHGNKSFGSDGGSRTRNPGSRSPMLCPIELHPNLEVLLAFNGNHAHWLNGTTDSISPVGLFNEHAFVFLADIL